MKLEWLPDGSPDCPIIRLYDFTKEEVALFRAAVQGLAKGLTERFELHCQEYLQPVGDCRLTLRVRRWNQAIVKVGEPADFECGLTTDGWDAMAGEIEPFTHGASGYQWLAGTPGEASLLLSWSGEW